MDLRWADRQRKIRKKRKSEPGTVLPGDLSFDRNSFRRISN